MESERIKIKSISGAEEFLEGIPQFSGEETGFKYGVERARLLLEYTGNPERSLQIIHIAGSNGKGSVCALLDTALQAARFKTGLFTSPHLHNIRERIRLCSEMIGEDDFVRLLNKVNDAVWSICKRHSGFTPAYFEYFFVIAMLYYKEKKADYVLLEAGMGGRLDATNACEKPVICIITSVSLEHTGVLGNTIKEIAAEKAGIMKPEVPALVSDENKAALEVFYAQARVKKSPLFVFKKSSVSINAVSDENIDFSLHNRYYRNVTVSLPIPALYEAENAGLALTALGVLLEQWKDKKMGHAVLREFLPDILREISAFRWPGRMERIAKDIYVDGAHNIAGIRAFVESAATFAHGKENVLLFAVSDDKDKAEMIKRLCESGLFSEVVVTAFAGARGAEREQVADIFKALGQVNVITADNAVFGLNMALNRPHDYIFCTGSLFLIGELRKAILLE